MAEETNTIEHNQVTEQKDQPTPEQKKVDWNSAMIAVPLRSIMLSYNHLMYAVRTGTFKDLKIEELTSVTNNIAMLKRFIPEDLLKTVETDG